MKNIKSFKIFENYRGKNWIDYLSKGLGKLKSNPSYWYEEKREEHSIEFNNIDRISQNIREIFNDNGYAYNGYKNLITFSVWIKYSGSKSLVFNIRELDDEYFWVKVYLHRSRLHKIGFAYYYICDQESGLYSLLREIKKLLDTP